LKPVTGLMFSHADSAISGLAERGFLFLVESFFFGH